MISRLHLKNLGPMPELEIDFAPRLNVITGDNGLGKTLILDMAWYGLTRTWPEARKALPNFGAKGAAMIECAVRGSAGKESTISCTYDRKLQDWRVSKGKPTKPGLIVYARIDGGFSIWDPVRNHGQGKNDNSSGHAGEALRLNRSEVWDGAGLCLGLLLDWESWRLSDNGAWGLFGDVLLALSPAAASRDNLSIAAERLIPLPAERLQIGDKKPTPFFQMPYGKVPVTQCSAGMRRILAMAYMLVWAWLRHQEDAKLTGEEPTNSVVLLWDEVEAHLHPQWQRLILPAMMKVVSAILLRTRKSNVQILATTHAPLVLSSLETRCNDEQDRLLNLQIGKSGAVEQEIIPWAKYGDVTGWLTSPAMDLASSSETVNSRKQALDRRKTRVLDPYAVQNGWFQVILPSFELVLTNAVAAESRQLAEATLEALALGTGYEAIEARWSVYESHWNNGVIDLVGLRRDAPLIADAVEARMREGKPLPGPADSPAAPPVIAPRKRTYATRKRVIA